MTFRDEITGVIKAGSKRTRNSRFTVCSYFTAGYYDFLGAFGSDPFTSQDAGAVCRFGVDIFKNRTQG